MQNPALLSELQTQLQAGLNPARQLSLTPALMPAGALSAFIAGLPSQTFALEGAAITSVGASGSEVLSVTGRAPGPLPLPTLDVISLRDINVDITFHQASATAPIGGTLTISGATMASASNSILLGGALQPDGSLALSLSPHNTSTPNVNLADLIEAISGSDVAIPALRSVPLFNAVPVQGVDLNVVFGANPDLTLGVSVHVTGRWSIIDGDAFALSNPSASLVVRRRTASDGAQVPMTFGAYVGATTIIGSESFNVEIDLDEDAPFDVTIVPDDGKLAPALLDIAALVGGAELRSLVQTGISALGLGDVAVDAIRLGVDVPARKLTGAALDGHLSLAGGPLTVVVQLLPNFTFSATLPASPKGQGAAPSGISLNALAAHVLSDAADLPAIAITALAIFADPHQGTFNATAETTENWAWDLSGHGSGPSLTLQNIGLEARKSPAGTTGGLNLTIAIGGFTLSMQGDYQGAGQGWLLNGSAVEAGGLDAGAFVHDLGQKIGVVVPEALTQAVGSLKLAALNGDLDTHTKALTLVAETMSSGAVPIGLKNYTLDLKLNLTSVIDATSGKRTFNGHFEADFAMGAATFVVTFDFGPVKVVTGRWTSQNGEKLSVADIVEALGIGGTVDIPGGLELDLTSAAFEYHSDSQSFTLSATSANFGDAFFTMAKQADGAWGFVFGVDSPKGGRLSDLPVVGGDLRAADFLSIEQAAFIVSSGSFAAFAVPALPQLPPAPARPGSQPAAGRSVKPVAAGSLLQLARGLSLAAVIDLTTSNDARIGNLKAMVGQAQLLLQISLGTSSLSLSAALPGSVAIAAGGKSSLKLGNAFVMIAVTPEIAFEVSGSLAFTINGTPVAATARLILSETEAEVTTTLSAAQAVLPGPPGIKGLHFGEFGIEMGVFFEPPGVDLGVQGQLRVGEVQSLQPDQFAFVLEMVEQLPNVLYLSFYIDKLDLGQVVTLFTDVSESGLIEQLQVVKASDLSFHWCESMVVLPDGTMSQPGFGLSATIQILSFGAHAELQVGATTGISGSAEMSPVSLGKVLHIAGAGKGIVRTYQQVGGTWTEVDNTKIVRQMPPLPTQREAVIQPGGPVIAFNSSQSPYLRVSLDVTLFDLVHEAVDATVSKSGFSFTLTYDLGSIAKFDLRCELDGVEHFSASGALAIHLDASIGPIHFAGVSVGSIHLVAVLQANTAITLDPAKFELDLSGWFSFEGLNLTMPSLSLSVAPASLKELPGDAIQQIRAHADQLFQALVGDVRKWADMVGRGVITGVTDMAGTLKNAYHVSEQEAAQLMRQARKGAEVVASGLKTAYGATAETAATALKGAGYATNEVASGLKSGYALSVQGVASALKGAGFAANEVAGGLKSAYGATAQQVAGALHDAGYAANDVANALRGVATVTAGLAATLASTANVLRAAGYSANEVGGALKSSYGATAGAATQALRAAGYGVNDVGGVLKNSYGVTADAAAQALKGAGYGVNEVGNALKSGFGATAQGAASALRGAGYAVSDTGNFVKSAYGLAGDQLSSALRGAGYAADEVKNAFEHVGDVIVAPIKHLDPRSW